MLVFINYCIIESSIKTQEVFGTHPAVHRQPTLFHTHHSLFSTFITYLFFIQWLLGIKQWRLPASWTQVC